jgi:hypothetical protein
LECGGLAPLWSMATLSRPFWFMLLDYEAHAGAGQSGARPPHSKELNSQARMPVLPP